MNIIPIKHITFNAQGVFVESYTGTLFEDGKWYNVTIDNYTEKAIAYNNGNKVTIAASDGTNTIFISTKAGTFVGLYDLEIECTALASTTIHITVDVIVTPDLDFETSYVYMPSQNRNQSLAFKLIHKFQLFVFKLLGIFVCKNLETLKSIVKLERYPNYVVLLSAHKIYEWVADSISAADDIDVIQPYHITTKGRWVKVEVLGGGTIAASQSNWNELDPLNISYIQNKPEIPTNVSDLENDEGYIKAADIPSIPTKTSDLSNDSNFVSDENYIHTDNNYTTEEKNKLFDINAGAEVNAINKIQLNGSELSISGKTVNIAAITEIKVNDSTITPDGGSVNIPVIKGESAYQVYVDNVPDGQTPMTETEWLASLAGTSGTKWHTTAESLVVGSDVIITDITEAKVGDYVFSTKNTVWGKIKGIVGSDYIITGVMNILEPVQVTYEELYALKESNNLTPGQVYEITDYRNRYQQAVSKEILTSETEPLIIKAISNNSFSTKAYSKLYPQDEIYYNFENTMDENPILAPGADRGFIFRRIDTKQRNDFPFDFRNIKFRRWQVTGNEWDAATVYSSKSIVKRNGFLYIGVGNNNVGIDPELNNNTITTLDSYAWIKCNFADMSYVSDTPTGLIGTLQFAVTGLYQDYLMFSTEEIYSMAKNNIALYDWHQQSSHNDSHLFAAFNTVFKKESLNPSYGYTGVTNNQIGGGFHKNTILWSFSGNKISITFYINLICDMFDNNLVHSHLRYNYMNKLVSHGTFTDWDIYGSVFGNNIKASSFLCGGGFYYSIIAGMCEGVLSIGYVKNIIAHKNIQYSDFSGIIENAVFKKEIAYTKSHNSLSNSTINARLDNVTFEGGIIYLTTGEAEIKDVVFGKNIANADLTTLIYPITPCRIEIVEGTPDKLCIKYLNADGRQCYSIVGLDGTILEAENVYETETNKESDIETYKESTTKYPTLKGLYDWAVAKFLLATKLVTSWSGTPSHENIPSEKLVYDDLAELDTNKIEYNTVINSLDTEDKTLNGAINEINAIAKGAANGETFATISALVTDLNIALNYPYGRNLYVVDTEVPDFWISAIAETSVPYTYSDDATFLSDMAITGSLQVGLFIISELETQKVDLTDYYTKSETDGQIASATKQIHTGVAVTGTGTGISATVLGSKEGDYYKNTTTSFWYIATAPNTWDYKGSDKGIQGIKGEKGDPLEFSDYQQEAATNSSEFLVFFKDVGGTPTPRIMTFQDLKDLLATI